MHSRRNFISGALSALGGVTLAGCSLFRSSKPLEYVDSDLLDRIDYLKSSNLGLDNTPITTHKITSKKKGEADLEGLVHDPKATQTLNWLLFTAQGHDEGVWYYVGSTSDSRSIYSAQLFKSGEPEKLLENEGKKTTPLSCAFYGFHPTAVVVAPYKKQFEEVKKEGNITEHHFPNSRIEAASIPSPLEIAFHIELEQDCDTKKYTHEPSRIIAPGGTFTFSATEKLKAKYHAEGMPGLLKLHTMAYTVGQGAKDVRAAMDVLRGTGGLEISYKQRLFTENIVFR